MRGKGGVSDTKIHTQGPLCVHVFVLRNDLSTSQPSEALGDSDRAGIGF